MQRVNLIMDEPSRVSKITLRPNEISPEHFHSSVTENVVCLSGQINLVVGEEKRTITLNPGDIREVEPKVRHHLANSLNSISEYLLVQGGQYDFVRVNA